MSNWHESGVEIVESGNCNSAARVEEFARLLGEIQQALLVYLMGLLQDRHVVDDILQETNLVLWREFDSFTPGTNFAAWACRVAHNQVRAWRKTRQRDRLRFSDVFLDAVAQELDSRAGDIDRRLDALVDCLQELPEHHRQLIQARYADRGSIDEIALGTNRSTTAIYRMLSRIRLALVECIRRKMASSESP